MAFLPYAFNARTVAPAAEFGAIPAGEYLVSIVKSSVENTKAGDGQYLKLVFSVLEGLHKGAQVFDMLNLVNRNTDTVDIAQRKLSAICHAVGIMDVTQSEQLHDKPIRIKVSYEPAKGEYGENNRVKAYKAATAKSSSSPARAGELLPAAGKVQPWKKAPSMHMADSSTKMEAIADDVPF